MIEVENQGHLTVITSYNESCEVELTLTPEEVASIVHNFNELQKQKFELSLEYLKRVEVHDVNS